MANVYVIRRVWNPSTGYEYKYGDDYTDNGDGTVAVVPGSQLATDGSTGKLDRILYSDAAPTDPLLFKVDASYSGIRKVTSPSQAFAAGSTINAHELSIHVNEHIDGNQTNISFTVFAADSGAQALAVGDYVCAQLGNVNLSGTVLGRGAWYFKVVQRDAEQDSRGQRFYRYVCGDLSEDIRQASVGSIPRKAEANNVSFPGDTGGPIQQGVEGQRAYLLSMLLQAVKPSYATVVLNAPDYVLEQLPEEGDGFDLLTAALKASGYYLYWEGTRLVVDQHEPAFHNVGLALTASQVLEAKTELSPSGSPQYDSVRIERPTPRRRFRDTGGKDPDPAYPPQDPSGSAVMPAEADTFERLSGETVLYEVNHEWNPTTEYVKQEPQDLLYAFSDTEFLRSTTAGQIYALLRFMPQQCTIQPPVRWTQDRIHGPDGYDWYFRVKPSFLKVSQSNLDYVDGFIVERDGYFLDTGAINRNVAGIPGVVVTLVGLETGKILQTTTNGEGYYRAATGGTRDKWIVSAYHPTDVYQANKLDVYTTGHPYDDDPDNDGMGPDNRVAQEDLWRLLPTTVSFQVIYSTNREIPDGPQDATGDLPELYRGAGGFLWGDEAEASQLVLDAADLDIDTANVTSDVQAGLLSEKLIDRSAEEQQVYVITKPFGGAPTAPGRSIALRIGTDGGLNANVRIMHREIQVTRTGIYEVLSTAADNFVNETDRRFAKKATTEVRLRQLVRQDQDILSQLLSQAGLLDSVAGMGVK